MAQTVGIYTYLHASDAPILLLKVIGFNFVRLIILAKADNLNLSHLVSILTLYDPLLVKEAIVGGVFDEDLYQELRITLLNCIRAFTI